jgi:hypothetical protein
MLLHPVFRKVKEECFVGQRVNDQFSDEFGVIEQLMMEYLDLEKYVTILDEVKITKLDDGITVKCFTPFLTEEDIKKEIEKLEAVLEILKGE